LFTSWKDGAHDIDITPVVVIQLQRVGDQAYALSVNQFMYFTTPGGSIFLVVLAVSHLFDQIGAAEAVTIMLNFGTKKNTSSPFTSQI
jgi:hypothetical protein